MINIRVSSILILPVESLQIILQNSSDCDMVFLNSLTARDVFLRHFIKVPEWPGTHLMFLMGLLGYPYSYIYTQQTGMLKTMATTDTFFTIG